MLTRRGTLSINDVRRTLTAVGTQLTHERQAAERSQRAHDALYPPAPLELHRGGERVPVVLDSVGRIMPLDHLDEALAAARRVVVARGGEVRVTRAGRLLGSVGRAPAPRRPEDIVPTKSRRVYS